MKIGKITSLGLVLIVFNSHLFAEKKLPYEHYFSAGAGVPNLPRLVFGEGIPVLTKLFFSGSAGVSNKANFKSSGAGPFHLKYEKRVYSWLGVGVNINHVSYKITYNENALDTVHGVIVPANVTISNRNTAVNLRTNFHFINPQNNEKMDFYLGFGFGYRFGKFKVSTDMMGFTPSVKLPGFLKMGAEITLGARYFFSKNIGAYAEIGLAKSVIQCGVTSRF